MATIIPIVDDLAAEPAPGEIKMLKRFPCTRRRARASTTAPTQNMPRQSARTLRYLAARSAMEELQLRLLQDQRPCFPLFLSHAYRVLLPPFLARPSGRQNVMHVTSTVLLAVTTRNLPLTQSLLTISNRVCARTRNQSVELLFSPLLGHHVRVAHSPHVRRLSLHAPGVIDAVAVVTTTVVLTTLLDTLTPPSHVYLARMRRMTLLMHVIAVIVSVPLFMTRSPPLGTAAAETPQSLSFVVVDDAVCADLDVLPAKGLHARPRSWLQLVSQALNHAHALCHMLPANVMALAVTTVRVQPKLRLTTLPIRSFRRTNVRAFSKPQ